VRRRIGAGALQAQPTAAIDSSAIDTGALFESQFGRLSAALRELRAIDRRREAELRALRERLAIIEAVHQATLEQQLAPALSSIDAMIRETAHVLQPVPAPPATATLFERMCARAAVRDPGYTHREALLALASALVDLRAQLAAIVEE
jgi:hypothetical protein